MLTRLHGGHIIDPVTGQDSVEDVWFEKGRIVARPQGREPDASFDVAGHIVMAGAIDVHSHIAGGGVNTARLLLPETHPAHQSPPKGHAAIRGGLDRIRNGPPLRADGFHHGHRARGPAASRLARASRDGGHSDHRQRVFDGSRE